MKFLSVMDPLSALNLPKDTTVGFMNAAAARDHELWMCTARDLYLEGDQAYALAYRVRVIKDDVIEQVGREALNVSELESSV